MPSDDKDWDQHHREVRRKLGWAPLLANGALIVAIVGGGSQSVDPAASISLVTIPLILFGLGAFAGLASEELALRGDIEWKNGTAWWEDTEGPAKQLMRLAAEINSLGAKHPVTATVKERADEARRLAERAQKEGPAATDRVRKSRRLGQAAAVLRWISALFCAIGFAGLVLGANGYLSASPP